MSRDPREQEAYEAGRLAGFEDGLDAGETRRTICSCGHGRGEHSGCLVGWGPGSIQSGTGCPCQFFDGIPPSPETTPAPDAGLRAALEATRRPYHAALHGPEQDADDCDRQWCPRIRAALAALPQPGEPTK